MTLITADQSAVDELEYVFCIDSEGLAGAGSASIIARVHRGNCPNEVR